MRGAYGRSPGATDEGGDHDCVVVLVDLGADPEYAFRPGTAMGVARLLTTGRGRELCERTRAVLTTLRARPRGRDTTAAAEALGEAEPLREHRAAVSNRAHAARAAALHRVLTAARRGLHTAARRTPPLPRLRGAAPRAGRPRHRGRPPAGGGTGAAAGAVRPGRPPLRRRPACPAGAAVHRRAVHRRAVHRRVGGRHDGGGSAGARASLETALRELTVSGPAAPHPVKSPDADGSPA
ncbi:hypothetical protein LUW77_25455 [Streptomyces radiopugnans]|nr:hypothetical protein LUW77_25455 [Streptomyces radiopugnans]